MQTLLSKKVSGLEIETFKIFGTYDIREKSISSEPIFDCLEGDESGGQGSLQPQASTSLMEVANDASEAQFNLPLLSAQRVYGAGQATYTSYSKLRRHSRLRQYCRIADSRAEKLFLAN